MQKGRRGSSACIIEGLGDAALRRPADPALTERLRVLATEAGTAAANSQRSGQRSCRCGLLHDAIAFLGTWKLRIALRTHERPACLTLHDETSSFIDCMRSMGPNASVASFSQDISMTRRSHITPNL
eukprot:4537985-Pleurochrysis_carterae.AAC.4